jgi:hypothetical protein
MTPISKLKGITPDEAQRLASKGIDTIEQLWICVGKGETEIDRISALIGDRIRLMELLTEEGLRKSGSLGDSWIARHWLDLTLLFALIIVIVLIVRAVRA